MGTNILRTDPTSKADYSPEKKGEDAIDSVAVAIQLQYNAELNGCKSYYTLANTAVSRMAFLDYVYNICVFPTHLYPGHADSHDQRSLDLV